MGKMKWILAPVMLVCTSWLSAAVNLMGVTLAAATFATQALLQVTGIRRALNIPLMKPPKPATPAPVSPQDAIYEAPRQATSVREKLSSNITEMRQGISEGLEKLTGQARGTAQEEAEKKRRQTIKRLEETRAQQERDHFEQKYKGKK